jgi:hypothetical protein
MAQDLQELFKFGVGFFELFQREFALYGIKVGPSIKLLQGKHILPYYDLKDGNIYLSNFDPDMPAGKLQLLLIRSLLSCETNDEFFEFYRLTLPWMIGHELGHHLRQTYGLFGKNLWQEEQIANYLGFALTKHRYTPQQKSRIQFLLRRAIEGLAKKMQSTNIATVSYANILHAMQVSGQIDQAAVENVEMMQRMFAVNPEDMLLHSGQLSNAEVEGLQQRDEVISTINEEYTSDITRYLYYHLGWMYLGISSREAYTVDEFTRTHLNQSSDLLPGVRIHFTPTEDQIQAYYQASARSASFSETAGHYFYKRYRSLLVMFLKSLTATQELRDEAVLLLENWRYGDFDTLNYLAEIVPEEVRYLLPNTIAEKPSRVSRLESYFAEETDNRLWLHVMYRAEDSAAANTLKRLAMLDKTDIYSVLSSEVAMDVIHELRCVRLSTGETIIWQGEMNNDVFILSEGRLGVLHEEAEYHPSQAEQYIGYIEPGQVLGEVAFFTREARNATVRALVPSVCYVLKASALQLFSYNDPAMLMQMAGALAHRLNDVMRKYDSVR